MQFIRVAGMMDGVEPLKARLEAELSAGKRVLWLVPGGSNIPLSAEVSRRLSPELTNHLTVMLTDERYGNVGHPDSNTLQLELAGFSAGQATVHAVLQNLSFEETIARYATDFSDAVSSSDVVIGQFGMGPDGHIAGILPGTPAVTSTDLVAGYDAQTFTRTTLTPVAIRLITMAYVFAFGRGKVEALNNLHDQNLPLEQQPAQIIKQLSDAYVYNDLIA